MSRGFKIVFFTSAKNIVPPPKTGGIEQPLYYLIRELAKNGHGVVLYAGNESKIPGVETRCIIPDKTNRKAFNDLEGSLREKAISFVDSISLVDFFSSRENNNYDIICFYGYKFYEYLPFSRFTDLPVIIQINYPHEELYSGFKEVIKKYKNVPSLTSMSDSIRQVMPELPYLETIYPVPDFNDFFFRQGRKKFSFYRPDLSGRKERTSP